MTDLADLVDTLKREVAIPGGFVAAFPNTTDDDLVGALADGFSECQLDGWMLQIALDLDAGTVSPDLSPAGKALVSIYSGIRILRNALVNQTSHVRYEAKGNVYESDKGAGLLREALKDLNDRRQQLYLLRLRRDGTRVYTHDGYMIHATSFYPLEMGELLDPFLDNVATGSPATWGLDYAMSQITPGSP